jgi:hypothetical protein
MPFVFIQPKGAQRFKCNISMVQENSHFFALSTKREEIIYPFLGGRQRRQMCREPGDVATLRGKG